MKKFVEFCKHPLVLLLVGSALSYLLIPWITDRSSHKRVLQEERVERAVDILKQGLTDDQKLISMLNLFEMFNKDVEADPKTYKTAQAELKTSFDKQYLDFDQHAWWWGHDLPIQSGLLELPPESKKDHRIPEWRIFEKPARRSEANRHAESEIYRQGLCTRRPA